MVASYTRLYDPDGVDLDFAYWKSFGPAGLGRAPIRRASTRSSDPRIQFVAEGLVSGKELQGVFIGDYNSVAFGPDLRFRVSWTDFRGRPGTTHPAESGRVHAGGADPRLTASTGPGWEPVTPSGVTEEPAPATARPTVMPTARLQARSAPRRLAAPVTARRALAIVPVAVGVLLLSGCGDPTPAGSGPGAPTTAGGSPTAATPSGTESSTTSPPTGTPPASGRPSGTPPASGRPLVLDGVVEAGVEPGCKVLVSRTGQYLIIGGKDVPMGVPVRVKGVPVTGVSTTCQQGTPLRVLDVQRR